MDSLGTHEECKKHFPINSIQYVLQNADSAQVTVLDSL